MLIILDVETYLYKACTACKVLKQCETDPMIWGEYYDLRHGIKFIDDTVNRLCETLLTNEIILVIGDKENFRKKINPQYKAQRSPKPPMYEQLLDLIHKKYEVVSLPNLEADDTCRIMYEDNQNYPCRKVIVSVDKDFYSVPCEFLRDLNGNQQVEVISEKDAEKHLMKQIIMGDSADNYKGIKGCGEKFCEEFITDETTFYDVLQLYKDKGLTPTDYTTNKAMAHIVSIDEYDFNTGKVTIK